MILRKPHDVVTQLLAEAPSLDWLRAVTDDLDRQLRASPLERLLKHWGLSASEGGRIFGVSRQAVSKWLQDGVPADRMTALMDLASATDILCRKVKRERIPAIVRRPADNLNGQSLLDLALAGRHADVLSAVTSTFDLRRIQP